MPTVDYTSLRPVTRASPALTALLGWLLPGAGYFLIGLRPRAIIVGVTIITLFLSGILIAGVRVIDVPGYDRMGQEVRIDPNGLRMESISRNQHYQYGDRALLSRGLFGEVVNKPWYVCQILSGPICLMASKFSLEAARAGVPVSHARIPEIGTLYTAVAGLLNLLAIIDAAHRAAHPPASEGKT